MWLAQLRGERESAWTEKKKLLIFSHFLRHTHEGLFSSCEKQIESRPFRVQWDKNVEASEALKLYSSSVFPLPVWRLYFTLWVPIQALQVPLTSSNLHTTFISIKHSHYFLYSLFLCNGTHWISVIQRGKWQLRPIGMHPSRPYIP